MMRLGCRPRHNIFDDTALSEPFSPSILCFPSRLSACLSHNHSWKWCMLDLNFGWENISFALSSLCITIECKLPKEAMFKLKIWRKGESSKHRIKELIEFHFFVFLEGAICRGQSILLQPVDLGLQTFDFVLKTHRFRKFVPLILFFLGLFSIKHDVIVVRWKLHFRRIKVWFSSNRIFIMRNW